MRELAARQHGLITRAQLLGCGLSRKQIRARVELGYLLELHRGVYLLGHGRPTRAEHLHGALLAARPGAFLSHRTAAAVLRLRPSNVNVIEITVVGSARRTCPPLRFHRTRKRPVRDELRVTDGLVHSAFARVLVELSGRETTEELTRLIEEGVRRRLFFLDKVEAALERHARRPGLANLAGPLAVYLDRSDRRSWLERAFDRELERRPDIPPPERNVFVQAGGIRWEIDCLWREERVIVELDGRPWHVCEREMEKDKLKDMKLATLGFVPLRLTARRFERDLAASLDDVATVLASRRAAA
jgi:hypothetical protein